MSNECRVQCDCGAVELSIVGTPIVHAFCHCVDCRALLNVPYHSVTAWKKECVSVIKGEDALSVFRHREMAMERFFCDHCGEVLFNTNVAGWRVVSQLLIAKCNDDELPAELRSDKHFFYTQRIVDVNDDLPKYLRGTDGPLYEGLA